MSVDMSEDADSNSSSRKLTSKSKVFIAEPESISPILSPLEQTHISNLQKHGLRHRASLNKRLAGRASISPTPSPELRPRRSSRNDEPASEQTRSYEELHDNLLSQLSQWLQQEKEKRGKSLLGKLATSSSGQAEHGPTSAPSQHSDAGRESDTDTALEKLEKILANSDHLAHRLLGRSPSRKHHFPRRKSSLKQRPRRNSHTAGSSDTDYYDGDVLVPSVDSMLDNTKTLGFTGGAAADHALTRTVSRSVREEHWLQFKNEIVRLAHTLRLKGWRQVPLEAGSEIDVQRLSGALTNAVYVVTPPEHLANSAPVEDSSSSQEPAQQSSRQPKKLLLRIYGPQVEHLIDREAELQILKRLARKNIGPRLLGTFQNGRFEQYLNARTLTPEDLRHPETSKQIAKRMRELHDGVDLLDQERSAGPFVWQNWDKWVARCGEVITWVDAQVLAGKGPASPTETWKSKGLVCGVEWAKFRTAVEMYRKWLTKQYGSEHGVREQLVFAHNDTQYGNLLRLEPSGESPLLLPANEHRQLVVIDFEYANANPPGLEFANHFTEWCYNYHSPTHAWACNTSVYPTRKEQQSFLSAYVQHLPRYASASPTIRPLSRKSTSSISNFMLDSRGPPNSYDAEEAARDESVKKEVDLLMKETRLWRVANSAQWVAWGIVQAKVPGMEEALGEQRRKAEPQDNEGETTLELPVKDPTDLETSASSQQHEENTMTPSVEGGSEEDLDAEFDYLAYAQQRAFFFWGDLLELGLIKEDDLPEKIHREVKRIPY